MSGMRFNNIREQTPALLGRVCTYLTSPSKTENGQLIGGRALLPADAARCMAAVKSCFHKLGGRQFIHLTLTPTSDQPILSGTVLMDLATSIASYYDGYQSLFTVHTDTQHPHIHLLLNTVNYQTGRKFSQSKMDLNHLRGKFNDMLSERNFHIIRDSANDFWQDVEYTPGQGFACLEYDCVPEQNTTPPSVVTPFYTGQPHFQSEGGFTMFDNRTNYGYRNQRYPRRNDHDTPQPGTQIVMASDIPTTTIKCGPNINISGCTPYNLPDVQRLVEAQAAQTATAQQQAAQLAQAMQQQYQAANMSMNICIDVSCTYNINMGQSVPQPVMQQPPALPQPQYPQSLPQPDCTQQQFTQSLPEPDYTQQFPQFFNFPSSDNWYK